MSTTTKPEESQALRLSKNKRPIGRLNKLFCVCSCVVILLSIFIIPASAADNSVSSFLFYDDGSVYMEPGYDYYVINEYKSNSTTYYYLSYHTASEIEDYTVTKINASENLKISMSRKLWYYRFDTAADLFSFLRFNGTTCDTSSLAKRMESDNEYFYVKRSGIIMTNCSSLKTKFTDAGYPCDFTYYAYFNDTNSKQYILCFVTMSDSSSPVAVFSPSVPTYNSETQELTCSDTMYFFYANTLEGAIDFLVEENGHDLTSIKKGTSLGNVTEFVASSCSIVDTATNSVCFPTTRLEDLLGDSVGDSNGDSGSDNDNEHGGSGGSFGDDTSDDGFIKRFREFKSTLESLIDSLPSFFSWLPENFQSQLNGALITFAGLVVAMIVLKAIHG